MASAFVIRFRVCAASAELGPASGGGAKANLDSAIGMRAAQQREPRLIPFLAISHERAGTKWLTERIASPSKAWSVFRFNTTKTQVRVRAAKRFGKLRQKPVNKKIGQ